MDSVLSNVRESIVQLQKFSDTFYMINSEATASMRTKVLADRIDNLLLQIDVVKDSISKADYWLMRGLVYNVQPEFSTDCEESLSRSIKLDPCSVEAWNALGECLWKKGSVDSAKSCFEKALAKEKNKVSLRCLSMCLRSHDTSKSSTLDDRLKVLQESWKFAKEAVKLDSADGKSQYCFGNACFALFIASAQRNSFLLEQTRMAYNAAVADPKAASDSDLQHNRAMFFRLEEEYQICLDGFSEAIKLDPFFLAPRERLENLLAYLTRVTECVQKKGKLKAKRLTEMCKALSCSQKDFFLGPYAKEEFVNQRTNDTVKLAYRRLSELHYGPNKNTVVAGCIAGVILNDDSIPYTFCIVDEQQTCFAVTVYNFSQNFGVVIGQTIAIPEPYLIPADTAFQDKAFKFASIRVPTPEVLVLNGKKLGKENVALIQLTMSVSKDSLDDGR